MDNVKLAQLLFSDIDKTPEYYEEKYPVRQLKEGARVTRFAPSPTGFLHFGNLFTCLVS
jgi:glutamyl-tRNA synthetase